MMRCFLCDDAIADGADVVATVEGAYRRTSQMTHTLDVTDEIYLEHRICFYGSRWRRIWRDICSLLRCI